jgi:Uncharacterized protein encoded in toxicity protection region of plasmid R478, contains von Willebrand factor (vWF) domain
MGAERFAGESAQNFEQKCLCVLVLDVSGSMKGEKLDELNNGVKSFFSQIQNCDGVAEGTKDQLEVAIIQFDEDVRILRDPKLIEDDEFPPTLEQRGSVTETVLAIEEAIKLSEDRKAFYKSTGQRYYRPWIILMTDGEPYGKKASQADIDEISAKVAVDSQGKKYMMMGIGIGADANMELLKKMTAGKGMKLDGVKFGEFFQWLSASLSTVTQSKEGETVSIKDGVDNWMESFDI